MTAKGKTNIEDDHIQLIRGEEQHQPASLLTGDEAQSGDCGVACWGIVGAVVLALVLAAGLGTVNVFFYFGEYNCTVDKSSKCHCNHFDSWSCPKSDNNSERFKNIYKERDHEGPPMVDVYYGYSVAYEGVLGLIAVILLILRCKNFTTLESSTEKCIKRSCSTSEDLHLQLLLTIGFLLGSFVGKAAQLILLAGCDTEATSLGIRITAIVFRTAFTWAAATFIVFQVFVGKQKAHFRTTFCMRCLCVFLGLSSAFLVVATLVEAACMNQPSNVNIISQDVWNVVRPWSYTLEVGLYGQFVTLFAHFAAEEEQPKQETPPTVLDCSQEPRIIQQSESQQLNAETQVENRVRGIVFLFCVQCCILTTISITVSAVYLFWGNEHLNIKVVSICQIALHICIIILGTITLGRYAYYIREKKQTQSLLNAPQNTASTASGQKSNAKARAWLKWLFRGGNPERFIYIFYFVGALIFNAFDLAMYQMHDEYLQAKSKTIGSIETGFGFLSVIVQFSVVFCLKLLDDHGDDDKTGSESHRDIAHEGNGKTYWRLKYIICLMFLLASSISLAAVDSLREEKDADEIDIKNGSNDSGVYVGFDLFYPIVVDFRLHSFIMILSILLKEYRAMKDDRVKSTRSGYGTGNSEGRDE